MQFSCDGSHLATGGQDTILRLWKVQMSVTESNERRTGCDKQIVAPAQVYQVRLSTAPVVRPKKKVIVIGTSNADCRYFMESKQFHFIRFDGQGR